MGEVVNSLSRTGKILRPDVDYRIRGTLHVVRMLRQKTKHACFATFHSMRTRDQKVVPVQVRRPPPSMRNIQEGKLCTGSLATVFLLGSSRVRDLYG
jgi:hypothetical protein